MILNYSATIAELLFETMVDLGLVVTSKGVICRVSPSAWAILGYHPDEMVGHSAREFLYPADLDNTRAEMRASRMGHVTRQFECRYVHKDGTVVTLQWTGIWSEDARQHLFVGRDVTEVRTLMNLTNISSQLQSIDSFLKNYQLRLTNWHAFTVLDAILVLASLWVAYALLIPRPGTFPQTYALMERIGSEAMWGTFAAFAAVFKAAALLVVTTGRIQTATMMRSVGRCMSAIMWILIGASFWVGNPEYTLLGPVGILLGCFVLWADISQSAIGRRLCRHLKVR